MHIPTHILSGWVIGNCLPLKPKERLACMVAGTAQDLDGLGIAFGDDLYQRWHHVAFHGLPFCALLALILCVTLVRGLKRQLLCGLLFVGIGHVHLLMDYWGSGPGWPIVYFYPFSDMRFLNWNSWELFSWQNITASYVLVAVTVAIAIKRKRTPLEVIMPSLDAKLTRKSLSGTEPR